MHASTHSEHCSCQLKHLHHLVRTLDVFKQPPHSLRMVSESQSILFSLLCALTLSITQHLRLELLSTNAMAWKSTISLSLSLSQVSESEKFIFTEDDKVLAWPSKKVKTGLSTCSKSSTAIDLDQNAVNDDNTSTLSDLSDIEVVEVDPEKELGMLNIFAGRSRIHGHALQRLWKRVGALQYIVSLSLTLSLFSIMMAACATSSHALLRSARLLLVKSSTFKIRKISPWQPISSIMQFDALAKRLSKTQQIPMLGLCRVPLYSCFSLSKVRCLFSTLIEHTPTPKFGKCLTV